MGLISIEIPNSIISIGDEAFNYCYNLKKVIWLTNTPPNGYKNLNGKINYVSNDLYIGLNNIQVYPYLSSIFEEGGIKYVPVNPSERTCDVIDCDYDSDIENLIIDNIISHNGIELTVKQIMPYSLYKQDKIKSVNINNNGSIGEECFRNSGLTSITIGETVTSIGNSCFKDCYSLKNIIIVNRKTKLTLGHNESSPLFVDCPIDSVYIGGKIEYDKSSSKGYSPFYRNTSLRTVVITDNETEIYDNEFYGCTNLKDVKIGDGVKKIGNWAFSGCSNLDYFAFGTNVEIIGEEAFSDCTNVNNIISYSVNPPKCGTQALDDINKWNCTLKVLDKSVTAYQSADQWKDFFFIESLSIDGKVATPIIKLDDKTISITCETEKASIYYTLDGTNPTVESALYSGPFTLEKNCTIKAVATRLNYENSDISMLEVTSIQIYATSISLDKTEASIEEKSYLQLIATILPEHTTNKEVAWSSSKNSVASVDANGLVTMHSVGDAIITATTTDGTNLSATCSINVYSGIDGVNGNDVIVATIGDNIVVKNAKLGSNVRVYAADGSIITSEIATDGDVVIEAPVKGIYVVAIDGKSFKVLVK